MGLKQLGGNGIATHTIAALVSLLPSCCLVRASSTTLRDTYVPG